jgi:hypothetical protein
MCYMSRPSHSPWFSTKQYLMNSAKYKAPHCVFFQYPFVTFYFLCRNTFLSTLFSNAFTLQPSLTMSMFHIHTNQQVSLQIHTFESSGSHTGTGESTDSGLLFLIVSSVPPTESWDSPRNPLRLSPSKSLLITHSSWSLFPSNSMSRDLYGLNSVVK